jgi:formate dehydrogenase maturation protein FdhE
MIQTMTRAEWDRRIRRATELVSVYPFAAEGLRFYAHLAAFQQALHSDIQDALPDSANPAPSASLRDELDLFVLLPKFPGFLALVERIAPAPLAQAASVLAQRGSTAWQHAIQDFWQSGFESPAGVSELEMHSDVEPSEAIPSDRMLAWIFLQPYAEHLAGQRGHAGIDGTPSLCPLCGGKPIVGVLRGLGDGAKKSLICMLCAHEWDFRRIYCPACGEEREPQMAFYTAPEIAHVRVDVCDTCHTYLKSVDLTKTGLAVPIVDELAAIPLDLWAREHGYTKLQTNLLGL